MKRIGFLIALTATLVGSGCDEKSHDKIDQSLKVVIIRHAEKPEKGDNLSCLGHNRALALANVLHQKIGTPDYIYVPALDLDNSTKHSRMFQTVSPFAIKYNLTINTKYSSKDSNKLAKNVLRKSGTVLMVWDHSSISDLAGALGVTHTKAWDDSDFDTIWLISYKTGKAELTTDKEGLSPYPTCSF